MDDHQAMAGLIAAHLFAEGYQTDMAFSGEGALTKIQQHKPDLVVLDIRLPGIDGLETLRRIKALDENILVMMATGSYDSEECKKAYDYGATDYLTKPLDFKYLKNSILIQFS